MAETILVVDDEKEIMKLILVSNNQTLIPACVQAYIELQYFRRHLTENFHLQAPNNFDC